MPGCIRNLSLLILFLFVAFGGEVGAMTSDTTRKIKTGLNFGVLPLVSYNTDIGLKFGVLFSLYDYGKGLKFPAYRKMWRVELSRTTGGSGTNQLFFDASDLFGKAGLRLTADMSYLTDKACDFYGFNGAAVTYNRGFESEDDPTCISRVFYRMERNILRFSADLTGNLGSSPFRWQCGLALLDYHVGTVNIDRLNRNKEAGDMLPDTTLLYDLYHAWGMIREEEADGGINLLARGGIIYDTRDIEANPSRGMWSEVLFIADPGWLSNSENQYLRLSATHRQYFTLVRNRLSLACRLAYQGVIAGRAPFYTQSYIFSTFNSSTLIEGLGGSKTLRGVLRNRVTGDGIAYGNLELRWKFLYLDIKKQHFYFALNPFLDAGRVVTPYPVDESKLPTSYRYEDFFTGHGDKLHVTAGCGLHGAMNENFVVAGDIGYAFSSQDGGIGIYIGMNWLF